MSSPPPQEFGCQKEEKGLEEEQANPLRLRLAFNELLELALLNLKRLCQHPQL